jgi:hypothetical protein
MSTEEEPMNRYLLALIDHLHHLLDGWARALKPDEEQLFYCGNPKDWPAGREGETEHFAYRVTRVERSQGSWVVYGAAYPKRGRSGGISV